MFQAVVSPIRAFFRLEAASGVLLLAAAVAAFAIANSASGDAYRAWLAMEIPVGHMTVGQFVSDVLMAVFFFLVGMEIKRELAVGELRTFSRAALPAIAAFGGMIVPSLIYVAFNAGTAGQAGWGIPMATDIAFCIGALTLLKSRVPHALVVFITALAIFDDLGGILVIAIFYGHGLDPWWLLGALVVTGALFIANRLYLRSLVVWALGGVGLWFALHHGGVHPTIAGVVVGLMIPASATRDPDDIEYLEPPLGRFVHLLHPWVAFGIMPLFAFANAGVSLRGISPAEMTGGVALGAGLGLFLGKQVGVFLFTLAAVKLRFAEMPGNASLVKLYGVSIVAGIGFTVALFIAGLAFPGDSSLLDQAKIGILAASVLSAVLGCGLLAMTRPLTVTESSR